VSECITAARRLSSSSMVRWTTKVWAKAESGVVASVNCTERLRVDSAAFEIDTFAEWRVGRVPWPSVVEPASDLSLVTDERADMRYSMSTSPTYIDG
jgi:hypothetical protein